jgi:uncharacterized protein
MGPLYQLGHISEPLNLLIALLIGVGFGFFLEGSGFTNTRKLAGVFYGYDFVVLKVFFTAATTAAIGLFIMNYYELIDISLTFYPNTYWIPTLVGGFIMALGFIVGGFCPGTSFCAAATGKIDGMVFVGGVFIGILGYAFTYKTLFEDLRASGKMGRVSMGDWLGISEGLFIFLLAIVAIVAFVVVTKIQKKVNANHTDEFLEDLGL